MFRINLHIEEKVFKLNNKYIFFYAILSQNPAKKVPPTQKKSHRGFPLGPNDKMIYEIWLKFNLQQLVLQVIFASDSPKSTAYPQIQHEK